MCGIIAISSQQDVVLSLVRGLKRLEYRGYDSVGIATVNTLRELQCLRTTGKINHLEELVSDHSISGMLGIGHTRWATHGSPSFNNAHPHCAHEQIAIVHNGIIENYLPLKQQLQQRGVVFASSTDSEVIAYLIYEQYQQHHDLLKAVSTIRCQLQGAYAIAVISKDAPQQLVVACAGSPLVLGLGHQQCAVASDIAALLNLADDFIYLEQGDMADICLDKVRIYDRAGTEVVRPAHPSHITDNSCDRGDFCHYMLKEIYEQVAVSNAMIAYTSQLRQSKASPFDEQSLALFAKVERIQIIACGSSYHAGLVARHWFESIAGIACQVEIASEFRYRQAVIDDNSLLIAISQSGETADTLAAFCHAKNQPYIASLAICNVAQSSLARVADIFYQTQAGIEIGVASTKAFSAQLIALLTVTLLLAQQRGVSRTTCTQLWQQLDQLPQAIAQVLKQDDCIRQLAENFRHKQHCLFIGRGIHLPIALEGALKLKEISYIHAAAYAAGELKHGPLALVDEAVPVVFLMPNNALHPKVLSNLKEVQARGGQLIVFTEEKTVVDGGKGLHCLEIAAVNELISPIVYSVLLQLLAYHVAVIKGTNIDQPRNLAKSVTVE